MRQLSKHSGIVALTALVLSMAGTAARANPQVYQQAVGATLFVNTPSGLGSGALIDARARLVVSAYHVVEEYPDLTIYFPTHDEQGNLVTDPEFYKANKQSLAIHGRVIAKDPGRDVALIQLDWVPSTAHAVTLAARSASPGDDVHAIGNSGIDDGTLWRYSFGRVRQVYQRDISYKHEDGVVQHVHARVCETQVPTNSGDSGGPILNDRGELVGITSGSSTKEKLIQYAIDVTEIRAVLANAGIALATPAPVTNAPALSPWAK